MILAENQFYRTTIIFTVKVAIKMILIKQCPLKFDNSKSSKKQGYYPSIRVTIPVDIIKISNINPTDIFQWEYDSKTKQLKGKLVKNDDGIVLTRYKHNPNKQINSFIKDKKHKENKVMGWKPKP